MEDEEMSKYDLIATLVAIRESAKEHDETHTVDLINTIIKEMKNS